LRVIRDGVENWLCAICIDAHVPMPGFVDFVRAFGRGRGEITGCPNCGTTEEEVTATGLVGCPLCFEALPDRIWKPFGVERGRWTGKNGW